MSSLIEQAAQRLAQLREAGVEIPEPAATAAAGHPTAVASPPAKERPEPAPQSRRVEIDFARLVRTAMFMAQPDNQAIATSLYGSKADRRSHRDTGAGEIAVALGKDRFYTYMKRFGFGQLTEIDLGNEGPGTLKTPKDANWHESDLGTNSFGQGIAVTPVQIAAAVSAVANDGLLMKPYIVQRIVDGDRQVEVQPTVIRQAVTAETAHKLTDMLVEALTRSESASLVPGYRVAGKTGTAEIPVPGGYHPTLTLASFAGYLPADDPELLILVIIDRPTSSRWGSETASPTFKRIAEQLAVLLNILPDDIRESAAIEGEAQLTLNNEP